MKDAMGDIMKHAQQVQEKMKQVQEELKKMRITGESGAGLVTVIMNGRHDVLKVTIDPSLKDEPMEVLEDLIAAAVNDAVKKVEESNKEKISGLTTGLNIPTDFKMPF